MERWKEVFIGAIPKAVYQTPMLQWHSPEQYAIGARNERQIKR